jgi:hypothetical protein
MKNEIRKIINSKMLLIVATTISIAACKKNNVNPTNDYKENSASTIASNERQLTVYSGEQIFEGLFFGKGNFTTMLPSIKGVSPYAKLTPSEILKRDNFILKIKNDLKAQDPNYFTKLKTDLKAANVMQYDALIEKVSLDFSMNLLVDPIIRANFVKTYNLNVAEINTIVNNKNKVGLKTKLNSIGVFSAGLGYKNCLVSAVTLIGVSWEAAVVANTSAIVTGAIVVWAQVAYWASNKTTSVNHELAVAELYTALQSVN